MFSQAAKPLCIAIGIAVLAASSATAAEFVGSPTRVALTPFGDIVVSSYLDSKVVILDLVTLEVTAELEIKGNKGKGGNPLGVAWGADHLFVGNDSTGKVEIYERAKNGKWKIKHYLNSPDLFPKPTDIAVDEAADLVFVLTGGDEAVMVFTVNGEFLYTIGEGELHSPSGIAVDTNTGLVLVSDGGDPHGFFGPDVAARVQIFNDAGDLVGSIGGSSVASEFRFSRPEGLFVDGAGRVFLVDSVRGEVLVFEGGGWSWTGTTKFGGRGTGPGQLLHPLDVAVDPITADVVVTSRLTGRVVVFEQGGPTP